MGKNTNSNGILHSDRIFSFSNIRYELHFFAHGLGYLPQGVIAKIEQFQVGDRLWLAHELQNEYDKRALILNTQDHYIVGYLPRYLSATFC
ncbi:MAG: HIRAN domain-containing protein [Waterburya sp.]